MSEALLSQLVLAFAGALFGALLGGFARWTSGRTERRLRLTLDLYSEFHSPQMNHIRIIAHDAIESIGPVPAAYENAQGEAKDAIATIVHFWEKVALLMRVGALDIALARRFFGQYARWWDATLCDKHPQALEDPEWGRTLKDINWAFKRLSASAHGGARR